MTLRGTTPAGALAIGWALIGVLGGHLLTYAILFPDAHVHDRVVDASGHGWTALLGPASLTAVLIVLALGVLSGLGRGRVRGVRFTTLLLLQAGLFVGIELAERYATGGLTLDTLGHHLVAHHLASILIMGVAIQVITAWLGSRVSRAIAAVFRRFRIAPARRRLPHPHLVPGVIRVPVARSVRAHGCRGPPLLVLIPEQTI